MCGIAGIVGVKGFNCINLSKMTDIICHRGPDDEGFVMFDHADDCVINAGGRNTPDEVWHSESNYSPRSNIGEYKKNVNLGLGHRRLSIIDLSPDGHMPMCDSNKRFWITFNGEIYNYLELRTELELVGHKFSTKTDTEVILEAYCEWGEACLERFNGMWAFAIYDTAEKTLFLARDRFGIKPFYYWFSEDGNFCFGSEIKQFTVLEGWEAILNSQRAYDYLVYSILDHTDETLFKRVYQLSPGCYFKSKLVDIKPDNTGRIKVTKWYQLPEYSYKSSYENAVEGFRLRFEDAVRLHIRADVPVGSCLSGGLDSSSIVCVMNQILREQNVPDLQNTFSSCSHISRYDERKWINEVIDSTSINAQYIYPSVDNLFDDIDHITWHQDEPFGSTSIYMQWNVFDLASRNKIKVMLDGQGADELLAGYEAFLPPLYTSLFLNCDFLNLYKEIQYSKKYKNITGRQALKSIFFILMPKFIRKLIRSLNGYYKSSPDWMDINLLGAKIQHPFDLINVRSESIRSFSSSQITSSNLPSLLHWEDRNSMAHNIESRVPFLDYRLVDFSLNLPDKYKYYNGRSKRILRDSMAGTIPEKIRARIDKLGFATPEESWMKEDAGNIFRLKLEESILFSQGILNSKCLDLFDRFKTGEGKHDFLFWRMINFGIWMKKFSVSLDSDK